MKIIAFVSDVSGCFRYRVEQPLNALREFGVKSVWLPELPTNPFKNAHYLDEIISLIAQYDLVILQRCYDFNVAYTIKSACEFLRKPLVFDTDDDYFHLPPSNPGFKELNSKPEILQGYAQLLGMMDAVTVSTEELRRVLYRYNKNIEVFPNNVEMIYCGEYGPTRKALHQEQYGEDGKVKIVSLHGLVSVPAYRLVKENSGAKKAEHGEPVRTLRLGYTGTPTHREDYETITRSLDKLIDKYKNTMWTVFVGDEYFYQKANNGVGRLMHIRDCPYQMYMYQIRNFDIGIAPLVPNMFNMSKSPIKAVEYASWGIPSVLPNYVTYNREFTHGKNCLLYNNSGQFLEYVDALLSDENLRESLGRAARDHVRDNRLESVHAKRRYDFYKSLVEKTPKMLKFIPDKQDNKEIVNEPT